MVPIERLEQYRDPTAAIWNDPTDGNRVEVGKFYQLVVRAPTAATCSTRRRARTTRRPTSSRSTSRAGCSASTPAPAR
ncbi:hypothetical protein [Kutzneria kofuensis]|uniref:hypothetical protein n=1 Tax=Kutzneria kofuensis TaxID=103725 RepID=UPI0031E98A62